MASLAQTSATTILSVSTTLPATYDATGFQALTWTPVGEIGSLGTYGLKTNVVSWLPLDTALKSKRGGSQDAGSMQLQIARHNGADMTKLSAANSSRASIAFKVTMPALIGGADYFTGIVTSFEQNVGNADQIMQTNVGVELDNFIIYT